MNCTCGSPKSHKVHCKALTLDERRRIAEADFLTAAAQVCECEHKHAEALYKLARVQTTRSDHDRVLVAWDEEQAAGFALNKAMDQLDAARDLWRHSAAEAIRARGAGASE